MDTVVRTAAVGYHQPPAGTAIIDIESHTRAVCRTRRAAGFRAVHEAATFRIVASAGSGGHLLAVLLLRFLGVLRARPKHMITWGELKLAGPNGARAAWFRLRESRGGTHRHSNRASMSCARCGQSKTLFRRPLPVSSPKLSTPYTTAVRLVLRLGCGGARALRDSGRSLKHDGKAQPSHRLLGGASCGPRGGLSLGQARSRSSNHNVCVFIYKHDVSYTSGATERPTEEK